MGCPELSPAETSPGEGNRRGNDAELLEVRQDFYWLSQGPSREKDFQLKISSQKGSSICLGLAWGVVGLL